MEFYEMDGLLEFITDNIITAKTASRNDLETLLYEYPEDIYNLSGFRAFLEKDPQGERYAIQDFEYFIKPLIVMQVSGRLPDPGHEEKNIIRYNIPLSIFPGYHLSIDNTSIPAEESIEVIFKKKKRYGLTQWVGKVLEKQ